MVSEDRGRSAGSIPLRVLATAGRLFSDDTEATAVVVLRVVNNRPGKQCTVWTEDGQGGSSRPTRDRDLIHHVMLQGLQPRAVVFLSSPPQRFDLRRNKAERDVYC